MADPPGNPIMVRVDSPTASPKRWTRFTRPSAKVQDTLRSLESATGKPAGKPATRSTRGNSIETDIDAVEDGPKTRGSRETGKAMLEKMLELLRNVGGDVGELKGTIVKQEGVIQGLQTQMEGLREDYARETKESCDELLKTKSRWNKCANSWRPSRLP